MSGKAVRETLGFLAVVAGLVFVGVEIQQNTAAIRSATIQDVTNASSDALAALASDSALADLRLRGDADLASLSELESFQYLTYYRGHWLRFQNIFFQRDLGALQEEVWDTYARIICTDIRTVGIRASWPDHSSVLDPPFVQFVESCPST